MSILSTHAYSATAFLLDKVPFARSVLGMRNGLRIVYYHKVNADNVSYYFRGDISLQIFERQLDHLQKNFTVIPLSESLTRMSQGQSLNGYACVTFDDGFRENFTHVFPILKKRYIRATFFLIEDCLNNRTLMWRNKVLCIQNSLPKSSLIELLDNFEFSHGQASHSDLMSMSWNWPMEQKERLAEQLWETAKMPKIQSYLDENQPYLSDYEVRSMIAEGQEIGIHTRTHPICSRLCEKQVDDEIIGSWRRLSERFGTDITSFSYPFGRRCSKALEERILKHTNMRILLGISDNLSNDSHAELWERRGMESEYAKSISMFYLGPWKKKLGQLRFSQ